MSAGSIYKKLRGLNIKSRAWIEILLHCIGVRVYFSKTQGAFCKTTDADRFLGSLTSSRSDLGCWSVIGRSRVVGRARRRRELPARDSAVAGSPEMPNPVLRGSIRSRLGSEMINTLCVIHLCAQNREPEFGMACTMVGADLRGKAHRRARVRLLRGSGLGASVPVRVRGSNSSGNEARAGLCGVAVDMATAERRGGVLATKVAYTPLQHAQKEEGHLEVLTEARNRAGRWCREFGGKDRQ